MELSHEQIGLIADAVAQRLRAPLLTVAEVAAEYRCSARTVRRDLERHEIPKRDRHGALHDGGAHPVLISRSEWEARAPRATRVVIKEAAQH